MPPGSGCFSAKQHAGAGIGGVDRRERAGKPIADYDDVEFARRTSPFEPSSIRVP